ncbi:uncharacterized protein LOC103995275 [Musa acuminata AAA Group]|uniref:(wild Malaysian banana) hypothetical protein n=1 Tax=Musa acuminata subsp. malaccensis TaxID=214687 RepID=A0A804K9X4_MUSAM|nr:PREDICTED: uncharacterized protein LOC103995275 [Musa acuminata subsp. malaccensis]XP_018685415.1 PREDICTED: uncharacterized protein LOC103995275 [Musa acuminata subsp. malaccensis]CAG1832504.1 unnamed protein product [Musa acuminata subsp. malaccensis]
MKPFCGFLSPAGRKEGGRGNETDGGCSGGGGTGTGTVATRRSQMEKPPFRIAKDDSKPLLRDPILRSDPIETEQAVLRLPPFPRGNI